MRPWWLVALGACNWVYGLDGTQARDAAPKQFFDAPPDAAFGCPMDGTAPRFKTQLQQLPIAQCSYYIAAATTAVASCMGKGIAQGPIDGALDSVVDPGRVQPRLFPEGDRVFASNGATQMLEVLSFTNGSWIKTADVTAIPPMTLVQFSNPTRDLGGMRRVVMFTDVQNDITLTEYDLTGDWKLVMRESYALPISYAQVPSLTSDGLRLVFDTAIGGVGYASRSDLDNRFDNFQRLAVPAQAQTPFLTDDCGRIYFAGLDTVFWLQQL